MMSLNASLLNYFFISGFVLALIICIGFAFSFYVENKFKELDRDVDAISSQIETWAIEYEKQMARVDEIKKIQDSEAVRYAVTGKR